MWRTFLTPKWLGFHLLVAGGAVVMTLLGFWQLDRLENRRQFNEVLTMRTEQEPQPLRTVLAAAADGNDVEWTPVIVEGRWLPAEQVLVINRSQGGVAGRNVVTPLETADGTVIAVTRGFVSLAQEPPSVTGDTVLLRGLVRPSEPRGFGGVSDPATGRLAELQRLDLERLRVQLAPDLAPRLASWSVTLEASEPAQPAPLVPVPRPERTEGPHLSYAVQWFIFAGLALLGWVFAMRRSITSRRAPQRPAGPSAGPASASTAAATVGVGTPPSSPQ